MNYRQCVNCRIKPRNMSPEVRYLYATLFVDGSD